MLAQRILIVDDDLSWQELLTEVIGGVSGGQIQVASSFEQADALLDRRHFHLAFVDLRLRETVRELEGKKVARKLFAQDEGTSIVIATGHADVNTAITALKEWRVLDFVLKDEWNPDKVVQLVETGLPLAQRAYAARYESAIDWLRGDQPTFAWIAEALAVTGADATRFGAERRLGDFLNALLAGLFPLLPLAEGPRLTFDPAARRVAAVCWSKALAAAVRVAFGAPDALAVPDLAALRTVAEPGLGLAGHVTAVAEPRFEAFAVSRRGG